MLRRADERGDGIARGGVDPGSVVEVVSMAGEDDADTAALRQMLQQAERYLLPHRWCQRVVERHFGLGVGGVVAVFLFRIGGASADEWLWVVVGDLPSAYLVTDAARTPVAALEVYCSLMEDWVDAVRAGRGVGDAFPVEAPADEASANVLATRVAFLREHILDEELGPG